MRTKVLAALMAGTLHGAMAFAQPVAPQAGVYWDPDLSGSGFALEIQGEQAFVVAFSYDETGTAIWHAGSGIIEEDILAVTLEAFSGGPCLVCGPQADTPLPRNEPLELTLTFTGAGQALMTIAGFETVFELERFPLAEVQSEGTIAGQTFTMPDLTGRWLFTDTGDGTLHVVTELELASSGISDSGLAFFRAPDGSFGVACSRTIEGVFCEFRASDQPDETNVLFIAGEPDIAHDHIRGDGVVGVRLR